MKKELRDLVRNNCQDLRQSKQDFAAIYQVMFRLGDNILAEDNDGYRIHKVTYKEAKRQIETASAALYERIGSTHAFVALKMENCLEWIVAFWAILRSGNKPYLVNCRHPLSLSRNIMKSLNIHYVISNHSEDEPDDYVDSAMEYIDVMSLIETQEPAAIDDSHFENEIALSTSATSLNEVVCYYTGKELSNQLLNTETILKQNEQVSRHYHGQLKQLAFLPFYHIFGLVAVYFWFTYFGRTLVFMKDYAPDTILNTVRKHEVTHIFAVPMLWHTIEQQLNKELASRGEQTVQKFKKGIKICTALQNVAPHLGGILAKKIMSEVTSQVFGPSIQFCISGGSYIKDSTLQLFNGIGYPLHNGYGMSEIGITSVDLRDRPKELNTNSVGQAFSSVDYKFSDEGTLMVKGASTCHAMMINGIYQEMDEWFDTRDILTRDEKGNYYVKGRIGDSVIGENGENINPDMIEQRFQLSDAKNISVLGLTQKFLAAEPSEMSDKTGEKLTLIVQISPYLSAARIRKLMDEAYKMNDTLPLANRIAEFYLTKEDLAPKTAIKVGRAYVKKGLAEGSIHLISFRDYKEMPGNSEEKDASGKELNPELLDKVLEVVARSLDRKPEEIPVDAHIISELGASSLQYFEILANLAEEFSINTQLKENEYVYTVQEMCEYLEEHL